MPARDGTGPMGQGPMTGGGFGHCGREAKGSYGRRGMGFAGRQGRRYLSGGGDEPATGSMEAHRIKEEIQGLKDRIEALNSKLSKLSGTGGISCIAV